MSDRAFCGASGDCAGANDGTACAAGQVCSGGTCAVSCQSGLTDCAGTCSDVQSNNANCGACGTACQAGQVCSGGQCRLSCQAGLVDCGGKCIDPMADRAFCGASGSCLGASDGTVCATGQVCSSGTCAASCQAGLVDCARTCVDPNRDPRYCGANLACGTGQTCGSGFACDAGQCVLTCQAGLVDCGGRCVDPLTDRAYCGASGACTGAASGAVCAAGEVCSGGAGTANCPDGQVACGGRCVDPNYDPDYCGAGPACSGGNGCVAGEACYQGVCHTLCAPGLVMCGGTCIDPLVDATFCGASGYCTGIEAGEVCAVGAICRTGACTPDCMTATWDLASQPPESTLRSGAFGGQGAAAAYGRTAWLQTSDWSQLWLASGMRAQDDVISVEADVFVPMPPASGVDAVFALYSAASDHWVFGSIHVKSATAADVVWGATSSLAGGAVVLRSVAQIAYAPDSWHRLRLEHLVSSCAYRMLLDNVLVDAWVGPCEPTPTQYFLQSSGPSFQSTNVAWSNLRADTGVGPGCAPP